MCTYRVQECVDAQPSTSAQVGSDLHMVCTPTPFSNKKQNGMVCTQPSKVLFGFLVHLSRETKSHMHEVLDEVYL